MAASSKRGRADGLGLCRSLLLVLAALALPAIYCGKISRTADAPASSLVLTIDLRQGAALPDQTIIMVSTYATTGPACSTPSASVTPSACPVALGGHQALTVNGTAFPTFG